LSPFHPCIAFLCNSFDYTDFIGIGSLFSWRFAQKWIACIVPFISMFQLLIVQAGQMFPDKLY